MAPTEITKQHVIENYVQPARLKGQSTIEVRVGDVLKELGWTNRTPSVYSTLGSQPFMTEAGLQLIEKRGGPPSGGPSTTVRFVYRVLDSGFSANPSAKVIQNGAGLLDLYGILAQEFRELGGGEAYLRGERDWGPDTWERYEAERIQLEPKK
jgi:hypothetical protein